MVQKRKQNTGFRTAAKVGLVALGIGGLYAGFAHPIDGEFVSPYQGRRDIEGEPITAGIFSEKHKDFRGPDDKVYVADIARFVRDGSAHDSLGEKLEMDGVPYRVETRKYGFIGFPGDIPRARSIVPITHYIDKISD